MDSAGRSALIIEVIGSTVLVIGGTRGTGSLIVERLRRDSQRVRVLARDPARARGRLDASIEVVGGDLTKRETLAPAIRGAGAIIVTAGVRSMRPATESLIKATEYDGIANVVAAAREEGFSGRFLYMTSSGVTLPSWAAWALNIYKGNTLVWRRRAEEAIRGSRLDYTIIRAAVLVNAPPGRRAIVVSQQPRKLSFRHRIARGDVADAFVAALHHPRTSRATFDVEWGSGPRGSTTWESLYDPLRPDRAQ